MSALIPEGEETLLRTRPGIPFVLVYRQGWWLGPPIAIWLVHYAAARLWDPDPMPHLVLAAWLWLGLGLVWRIISWLSRSYVLTDRRLLVRAGVVARVLGDVPLSRIQHATVTQTILERLLGLGTLGIATAGSDGSVINLIMIAKPDQALAAIRAATDRARAASAPSDRPAKPSPARAPAPAVSLVGSESRSPSAPRPPIVVGLAGGIGSGKSEVARVLASRGCLVIDSDTEAKQALDRPDVRDQLVRWWGGSILAPDGRVDRKRVADIIFTDPKERRRLESLVHPIVRTRRADLIRRAPGAHVVVIDAPLLFEAGVDGECDTVIFVDAPRPIRLARVRASRGWDEAELARRESSQLSLEEKRRRSQHVVTNEGPPAELAGAAGRILDKILAAG